jgi:hypothetical protein
MTCKVPESDTRCKVLFMLKLKHLGTLEIAPCLRSLEECEQVMSSKEFTWLGNTWPLIMAWDYCLGDRKGFTFVTDQLEPSKLAGPIRARLGLACNCPKAALMNEGCTCGGN